MKVMFFTTCLEINKQTKYSYNKAHKEIPESQKMRKLIQQAFMG